MSKKAFGINVFSCLIGIFSTFFWISTTSVCAAPVPDTGQTLCYDNAGEIPCPQPGEPFYGQDAQYGDNLHFYTDLGNGIVRDNVTGLEWEVKSNKDGTLDYSNPNDADNTYTWYDGSMGTPGPGNDTEDFLNDLNAANYGGHDDWRLPSIDELATLVDSNIASPLPSIDPSYFSNTMAERYWSSTRYFFLPPGGYVWIVHFNDGSVAYDHWSETYNRFARAVRSGQPMVNEFVNNGDSTVTDISTGLMWSQLTYGPHTWEQALAHCEGLELAGYRDWRLPNRNELHSIVDYSLWDPAINTDYFSWRSDYFWSSTTWVSYPYRTRAINFFNGFVGRPKKDDSYPFTRAVRTAQCGPPGDLDHDGVCDDGDESDIAGDNPCTCGNTTFCDDNCPDVANPDQTDQDEDGIGGACDSDDDLRSLDILNVTTNQGPEGSSVTLDNGTCIFLETHNIIWASQAFCYPDDGLGWASRKGVDHTYFSYKLTTDTLWQPEVETVHYGSPGYYGLWSWVYPTTQIGVDGDYDIRLAAEDGDGNRSEVIYEITIATIDTDADDTPDCIDNCPAFCNPLQLDADLDGIGDLCDPEPNCGEGCQPACEEPCPLL